MQLSNTLNSNINTLSSLPEKGSDLGMIIDPLETNIIWFIGGYYFKKIYYYNKLENKMIENKCNLNDLQVTQIEKDDKITAINIITGAYVVF